ncbi:hypothetical protein [Rhizosaccharibacter radicis]|uniref:Uncharacterized protein n=1 Tax=Rhizosaccharibacter radicis TaxID=2782605 RepID=A0ABT1W1Y7_9PROT|nr:hypothetical protein [Acetobacteraceae bacterium KSS12]
MLSYADPAPRRTVPATPPHVGDPWLPEEERHLHQSMAAGRTIGVMARQHGRTEEGIRSRLRKLGLLDGDGLPVRPVPPFVPSASATRHLNRPGRDAGPSAGEGRAGGDQALSACLVVPSVSRTVAQGATPAAPPGDPAAARCAPTPPPGSRSPSIPPAEERSFLQMLRRLPPSRRVTAMTLLRALAALEGDRPAS